MITRNHNKLLTLLLLLIVNTLSAQEISVIDNTTLQPIPGAVIRNLSNDSVYYTDQTGKTSIFGSATSISYQISSVGYMDRILTLEEITTNKGVIAMKESGFSIDEVVVSASKFEEKKKDVAQNIRVLNRNELERMNQSSTADVLNNQGNIFVQKSQLGGGSPIIRGFETNKVLLVIDGVRMNNAIYRTGHLQNVITLDNSILDRVEVVFGPGSVVYGSDALGGVMHFYTRNPLLSSTDKVLVKANAYSRYSSAANSFAEHADISVGRRKFGSLTSFTYTNFDDLRQGSNRNPFYGDFGARNFYAERINGVDSMIVNPDKNLQVGSGYSQYDILQKFTYQPNKHFRHLLNFQYSSSTDVPRYDRLVEMSGGKPKFAEWYYGPQNRALVSYNLTVSKAYVLFDHAKFITAYQKIQESRMDRRFGNDNKNHRIEDVDVISVNMDLDKMVGDHEIRYGADLNYNMIASSAFSENIVTGVTSDLNTRYPDGGATTLSSAVYVTHAWEISPRIILNDGVRFSNNILQAKFSDKSFFPFPFDEVKQNSAAINGNIGFIFEPLKEWRLTTTFATAFRSPNVDDLGKVFESVPGSLVVPNPDLVPEYSYNFEVGISKTFNNNLHFAVTNYYTIVRNLITTDRATFNGADSILYDGQMSRILTSTNKGRAYIYGIEAVIKGNITNDLQVFSTVNYTYGRILTDSTDYPLDHIPPVFGRTGFSYIIKRFRTEFFAQYSGWKKLKDYNLVGEDNIAFATAEGMPAWYTLNARLGYQFSKYLSLQLACENILDANYRVFASNISAPGRNFIATLRFSL